MGRRATSMNHIKWSKTEKEAARRVFEEAYRRECGSIANKVKEMIAMASEPPDLWRIHDYLTKQRRGTDEKYDLRYSVLLFVFARLVKEGWIEEADLEGLREDKIKWIKQLAGV
jgi:hypothetical protein